MDASKHHPNGGATPHCNNHLIERAITEYQTSQDVRSLDAIVSLTQPRALTLIRFYRTTKYKSRDELLSDVNFKLLKAVETFDPMKGSAFTFVSKVISNVLFTAVANARKDTARYKKLTRAVLSELTDNSESPHAVEDIAHRIKSGAKTTLTDERELSAQKWYIESFCADGFESRRHECANACMGVFGLSHARSRELYDLTMLEVRRVLYFDVQRRATIYVHRLHGTRLAWMTRYATLMSQDEFTMFVVLMRDLAPYLLLLIDTQNRSRRQDRNPAISRRNIELILYGDPDSVALFNGSISGDKGLIFDDPHA